MAARGPSTQLTHYRLEKPERLAALARLTVVGLLVYAVIQRQVRLSPRSWAAHPRQYRPDGHADDGRGLCPLDASDAGPLHCGPGAATTNPWHPGGAAHRG